MPPGPSSLFIIPWGGRVAAVGPDESPLAGRDARFVVHPLALWEDPADDERVIGWVRGLRTDLAEHATGAAYLNFTGDEGAARVVAQYGEAGHARLGRLKAEWDPDDVFHAGGHVAPTVQLPGGIELAYAATGPSDGVPVVLLHGLFDQWRSFAPVLAHLDGDVRAYAVTQRGHTGSSRPATGYAIADLAGDVLAFLDAVGIERAVLAGHSLGALSALQAAIVAPDRITGLVLAPGFATARALPAIRELRNAVNTMDEELDRDFVEYLQEQAREPQLPDGFFDTMVDAALRMPAATCRALLEGIIAFDAGRELAKATAPALLLWGDEDVIVPRAQADALARELPAAELRVVPGSGHTPHWHDPHGFAHTLTRFAARVTS
jgi:pimeloyl-ACP methyl ester carboxylesterase